MKRWKSPSCDGGGSGGMRKETTRTVTKTMRTKGVFSASQVMLLLLVAVVIPGTTNNNNNFANALNSRHPDKPPTDPCELCDPTSTCTEMYGEFLECLCPDGNVVEPGKDCPPPTKGAAVAGMTGTTKDIPPPPPEGTPKEEPVGEGDVNANPPELPPKVPEENEPQPPPPADDKDLPGPPAKLPPAESTEHSVKECVSGLCDENSECRMDNGFPRCFCTNGNVVRPKYRCDIDKPPPPGPEPKVEEGEFSSSSSAAYANAAMGDPADDGTTTADAPPPPPGAYDDGSPPLVSGEHRAKPCEKNDCRDGSTCVVNKLGFADCHCPDGFTVVRPKYSCPAPPKASAYVHAAMGNPEENAAAAMGGMPPPPPPPPPEVKPAAPYVHAAMGNPEENAAMTKDIPRPPPPGDDDPCIPNRCDMDVKCTVGEGLPRCHCPSGKLVPPMISCETGQELSPPPPPPPPPVSSDSEAYGGMAGDVPPPPSDKSKPNPCDKNDCRDGSTCTVNEFGFADCHCPDGITIVRPKYSCPAPPKASAYVHAAMGNPEENAAGAMGGVPPPPPSGGMNDDAAAEVRAPPVVSAQQYKSSQCAIDRCDPIARCVIGAYGMARCECPNGEVIRPEDICDDGTPNRKRMMLRGGGTGTGAQKL